MSSATFKALTVTRKPHHNATGFDQSNQPKSIFRYSIRVISPSSDCNTGDSNLSARVPHWNHKHLASAPNVVNSKLPPDCHRRVPGSCLRRSHARSLGESLAKGGFDYFRRPVPITPPSRLSSIPSTQPIFRPEIAGEIKENASSRRREAVPCAIVRIVLSNCSGRQHGVELWNRIQSCLHKRVGVGTRPRMIIAVRSKLINFDHGANLRDQPLSLIAVYNQNRFR